MHKALASAKIIIKYGLIYDDRIIDSGSRIGLRDVRTNSTDTIQIIRDTGILLKKAKQSVSCMISY